MMLSTEKAMQEFTITIGKDYSPTPGGRYIRNGDHSGEHFRDTVLVPALKEHDHLTVYLDGTVGYAGSFLEEVFGGLIREAKFSPDDVRKKLSVAVNNPRYEIYRRMVEQYIQDAGKPSSDRVA